MPASWRVFIHAVRHRSSVPYSRSNSASVSPCMIARIGPIPLLVGRDSALIPSTIVEGVDWLISGQQIRVPAAAAPGVSAGETEAGDSLAGMMRARLALMPPQVATDYRALAQRDDP